MKALKKLTVIFVCVLTLAAMCGAACAAATLSNAEYERMLKECPEFADADKHLNETWKVLTQVSNPQNMQKYRDEQRHWANAARQESVANMLALEPMDKDLAYARVTKERALWLEELVRREKDPNNDQARAFEFSTFEVNKYRKTYDALIAEWKSALNKYKNQGYAAGEMLNFFYDSGDDSVKADYALYDIDGNGTVELILRKRNRYEDIIAYIFSIKDGKPINVFGYDKDGLPIEVPWSRAGSSVILANGLIDSIGGGYAIYKIAENGYTVTRIAYSEPYDYPDEANLAEAEWRYYANGEQVSYDFYVQYLNEQGYSMEANNAPAVIHWENIE